MDFTLLLVGISMAFGCLLGMKMQSFYDNKKVKNKNAKET